LAKDTRYIFHIQHALPLFAQWGIARLGNMNIALM
jgi:hypothetical protein